MKVHLPLRLFASLMNSLTGTTLGTITVAGFSGLLAAVVITSPAYAEETSLKWASEWGLESTPETTSSTIEVSETPYSLTENSSAVETWGILNAVTGTTATDGILAGGYYTEGDSSSGITITSDIWTMVTGGEYSMVIGGSLADNWWSGSAWNITGDVHTQLSGSTTSTDWLIGGTWKDAQGATITGDVYVAVTDGATINGSLIGGGVVPHSNLNTITGNVTVAVTSMQSYTDTSLSLGSISAGYIIGGSAFQTNTGSSTYIGGDTNVIIDLSGEESEGTFVKSIVGGSYHNNNTGYGDGTSNIGGSTSVSITANSNVTFSGDIYGGTYAPISSGSTVAGDSTLNLNGGNYSGNLYAGSVGTATTSGNAYLNVTGDVTFLSGSTLNAGNVDGTSSLSLGSDGGTITFNSTSISGFDTITLYQETTYSGNLSIDGGTLVLTGENGESITLDGTLSLSGSSSLDLDLSSFGTLADGQEVLTTSGLSNISSVAVTLAEGVGGYITISGTSLVFNASSLLVWNGGESGSWSTEGIWTDAGETATYSGTLPVSFLDLDGVSNSVVTIDEDVSPASVTVSNSGTRYEWTGEGSLTDTTVTKKGDGTLVIGSASVIGDNVAVTVKEGVLAFGYDANLSTDSNLQNLTWASGSFLGATDGATVTVDLDSLSSPAFSLSPDEGSSIVLTTAGDVDFDNDIAGEGDVIIRASNDGSVGLTGNMSGHIVMEEGMLIVGDGSSVDWGEAGSSVTLTDGTSMLVYGDPSYHHAIGSDLILGTNAGDEVTVLWYDASQASGDSYQHDFSGTVTVNGDVTFTGYTDWSKEVAFTGTLQGEGNITYQRGASDGAYNSNGKMVIDGDASGFTGTITIDSSNGYSAGLDLLSSVANGTINLVNGSSNENYAFIRIRDDVTIGALNGDSDTLVGAVGGEYTLTVGSGDFEGTLQDKSWAAEYGKTSPSLDADGVLNLVKISDGTLTLSGTVDYSGSTTIQGGTLALTGTSNLSTLTLAGGDLSLGDGANTSTTTATFLAISDAGGTLNINSNASLELSDASSVSGLTGSGSLALNGSSLTISQASGTTFSGTLAGESGSIIVDGGSQTISGAGNEDYTLTVTNKGTLTLEGAGSDTYLASYAGVTVTDGSTLVIGTGDATPTQLSLGTNGLTVSGDSTVTIEFSATSLSDLSSQSLVLTTTGTITLEDGFTLNLDNLSGMLDAGEDEVSITLFAAKEISLGTYSLINNLVSSQYALILNVNEYDGLQYLTLTSYQVPEPTTATLSLLGLGALLLRRRRH